MLVLVLALVLVLVLKGEQKAHGDRTRHRCSEGHALVVRIMLCTVALLSHVRTGSRSLAGEVAVHLGVELSSCLLGAKIFGCLINLATALLATLGLALAGIFRVGVGAVGRPVAFVAAAEARTRGLLLVTASLWGTRSDGGRGN